MVNSLMEKDLVDNLKKTLGQKLKVIESTECRIKIETSPENLLEVATSIKKLGFDQVMSNGGTDYPDKNIFKLDYHIISVNVKKLRRTVLQLTTHIPKDNATIKTLITIFPSASYHEQETHENLGIMFEGHPRMERLLLPEDWDDIPPLLKAFKLPGR